MRRGDVVTVAATGGYGKPHPAVIVQTDALPAEHASVVVCQMTSDCSVAPDFRVTRMRVKPRPFRAGKESAETLGDLFGGKAACSAARCTIE